MKINLKTPMEWFNFISYQTLKLGLLFNFIGHCYLTFAYNGYAFLDIMKNGYISQLFLCHLLTIALAHYHGYSKIPSAFGAVTTVLGFIPLFGWMLHFLTAILTGPLSMRLIFGCPYSKRHRGVKEREQLRNKSQAV